MDDEIKKNSEDMYADTDFSDDDSDEELKNAEFIDITPKKIKLNDTKDEKQSMFYDENDKLVAERIIEKKSGKVIEIKYNSLGKKQLVMEKDKDKHLRKTIDYYEGGTVQMITDFEKEGSYKSVVFNVDGSRQQYVVKNKDGTADAIYYDADGKGTNVLIKFDENKNAIEKRILKD